MLRIQVLTSSGNRNAGFVGGRCQGIIMSTQGDTLGTSPLDRQQRTKNGQFCRGSHRKARQSQGQVVQHEHPQYQAAGNSLQ